MESPSAEKVVKGLRATKIPLTNTAGNFHHTLQRFNGWTETFKCDKEKVLELYNTLKREF